MKRLVIYNPNPCGKQIGDCAVRAMAKALDLPWDKAYLLLCVYGFMMCDLPSANAVWGSLLRSRGFLKRIIDKAQYTLQDFAEEHQQGTFVVALSGHVVTCADGFVFDTWDSLAETPLYYWEKE